MRKIKSKKNMNPRWNEISSVCRDHMNLKIKNVND